MKKISVASQMVRNARLDKGWTQQQLGIMLGHNYGNFVGMIEGGVSHIPFNAIPKLCSLLDLDPKILLKEVMTCRYPVLVEFL